MTSIAIILKAILVMGITMMLNEKWKQPRNYKNFNRADSTLTVKMKHESIHSAAHREDSLRN